LILGRVLAPRQGKEYGNDGLAMEQDGGDPFSGKTLLGRRPSYQDVANAAVFAASDWAATMTATEINLTGGAVID
jgi:3-oxoacyl-[acyl-carrier protein] reductase